MKNTALVVVDLQEFFVDPSSHAFLPLSPHIERNIRLLVDAYRRRGLPIIFTRHAHGAESTLGSMGRWWGDPLMASSPLSKLRLEPAEGEVVVVKERYDAFHNTSLEEELEDRGVKELVFTGVMTDLCVETTARSAFVRDYDVMVVMDATTTQSEELHISSLITLAHGFAIIRRTDEILGEIGREMNE